MFIYLLAFGLGVANFLQFLIIQKRYKVTPLMMYYILAMFLIFARIVSIILIVKVTNDTYLTVNFFPDVIK